MKVSTVFNNFSRGQMDSNLKGRFDLPIFSSGAERFINFISNFQGNALYRPGTEYMEDLFDCNMIEFRFNYAQNYLVFAYNTKFRFMTFDSVGNFGYVLSGASPLEVTSPYSLAQSKEVQVAQNADVMYMTHHGIAPYKLTRTSATTFTMSTFDFKDGPYLPENSTTTTLTFSALTGSVTVTASAALFSSNDVGRLIRVAYTVSSTVTWYWLKITAYTDTTHVTATVMGDNLSAATATTRWRLGAFYTGCYPSACCFHNGRLFYANSDKQITTVWGSVVGDYDNFATGSDDDDAVYLTLSEITEEISWLFPAITSLVAGSSEGLCTIHGADVGDPITPTDVEAPKVNSEGCNSTIPLIKDGVVFYQSLTGRRLYSFNYNLLTESFVSEDANVVSYDITSSGVSQLKRIKTKHDLIFMVRSDGKLLSTNINLNEKVVSWHLHETDGLVKRIASITDNNGYPRLFLLIDRGGDYRLEMLSSFVDFPIRSDFYTGDAPEDIDDDDMAYAYKVADKLQECNFLDCMMSYENLQSNAITYNPTAHTITATSSVFTSGDAGKYIFYKTSTGYEHGRFEITAYTSGTVVTVSELNGAPTSNTYTDWYLSFSSVSGLTIFEGQEVSVVANGGYLGDFTVSSGAISLGTQVHSVKIGLPYVGEIKTFDLGFYVQGVNTQVNAKSVYEIVLRLINSSGGLVGTSKYKMASVQLCDTDGLWGLPALPIDGDEHRQLSDNIKRNKVVYIQQKEPMHFEICGMFVNAKYEQGI